MDLGKSLIWGGFNGAAAWQLSVMESRGLERSVLLLCFAAVTVEALNSESEDVEI
jgi:hypothetical protein